MDKIPKNETTVEILESEIFKAAIGDGKFAIAYAILRISDEVAILTDHIARIADEMEISNKDKPA